MADGKMIEYRVDNGVAILEINRPPVNSYTTDLLKELDAAILEARFDENVHAIVHHRQSGEVFLRRRRHQHAFEQAFEFQKQLRTARP